jgi:hypothetical protein
MKSSCREQLVLDNSRIFGPEQKFVAGTEISGPVVVLLFERGVELVEVFSIQDAAHPIGVV